jgi:uncharacterized protein (DUF3820 family)
MDMVPGKRILSGLVALLLVGVTGARELDLSNLKVSAREIGSGGVPIDGIPSIDDPQFVSVAEAERFMFGNDKVISVEEGDSARAYPLRILVWHEVVNDVVDDRPVAVTYCPLCATGMVFSREVEGAVGGTLEFGVSGLLHHSDVLMYDRESMGLWSQLGRRAISGKFAGRELVWLPSDQMRWKAWREKYPRGRVLSNDTGHDRAYHQSPYDNYHRSPYPLFKVRTSRSDLPMKARVIGIVHGGEARAYNVSGLKNGTFSDWIAAEQIEITYDKGSQLFQARTQSGEQLPAVWVYWFAWQAYYPDTELVRKLR